MTMSSGDQSAPLRDPRSPMLQAIAAALAIDATARAAGRADGEAGRPFQPGDHDILSYASGYQAGRLLRPGTVSTS